MDKVEQLIEMKAILKLVKGHPIMELATKEKIKGLLKAIKDDEVSNDKNK